MAWGRSALPRNRPEAFCSVSPLNLPFHSCAVMKSSSEGAHHAVVYLHAFRLPGYSSAGSVSFSGLRADWYDLDSRNHHRPVRGRRLWCQRHTNEPRIRTATYGDHDSDWFLRVYRFAAGHLQFNNRVEGLPQV